MNKSSESVFNHDRLGGLTIFSNSTLAGAMTGPAAEQDMSQVDPANASADELAQIADINALAQRTHEAHDEAAKLHAVAASAHRASIRDGNIIDETYHKEAAIGHDRQSIRHTKTAQALRTEGNADVTQTPQPEGVILA